MLNVMHRFASAAAAPILSQPLDEATLALAALFPSAGHAALGACWSRASAYFLLVAISRATAPAALRSPKAREESALLFARSARDAWLDGDAGRFVRGHDLATFLPAGALSALYMPIVQSIADRVIGIAIGTVLCRKCRAELTRAITPAPSPRNGGR